MAAPLSRKKEQEERIGLTEGVSKKGLKMTYQEPAVKTMAQ